MIQHYLKHATGATGYPCLIIGLALLFGVNDAHAELQGPGIHLAQNETPLSLTTQTTAELSGGQFDRDHAILKHQRILKSGYGTLGSGIGIILLGSILINIDPYGSIGMGGFVSAGIGVLVMGVGSFILGLFQKRRPPTIKFQARAAPFSN